MVLGVEVSWKVLLAPRSLLCAVAVEVESSNRLDRYWALADAKCG